VSALLVTGASGFIGSAVIATLRGQALNGRVICAGRRAEADWPLDLTESQLVLPEGVDTVLHLAGEKRDPACFEAVNHLGTRRLVDAAARAGARRFVHLSSVGVYGAAKHAGILDETWPHAPRNAYERSKSAGEAAVRERCAALGLECVVLQPSNVVGGGGAGRPLLGLARIVKRGWFHHLGRGPAWVNYVGVDDVAAAVVVAAQHGAACGVYIVNTPAPLREFVVWIAGALERPAPTRSLPRWLGATAAAVAGVAQRGLGRELPFSPARFQELTNTTRYDGNALARAFGFGYPVGIERTIAVMMADYRRQGLL
jgi:2-alkyl-3-oxoalkanoate reductase